MIIELRIKLLNKLFYSLGLRVIVGHWIYMKAIGEQSVVIDLGGNVGDFTKEISQFTQGLLCVVEPNKQLYDNMTLPNVIKLNNAIAHEDGPINFFIGNNHEASSTLIEFENKWGSTHATVVEGISWQMLRHKLNLSKTQIVDVLKVDVEGAELDLIESFSRDDFAVIARITVEFHDWINVALRPRTIQAIHKLRDHGYMIITNTPNHDWPLEILFINTALVKLSLAEKIKFSIARSFSFLKY